MDEHPHEDGTSTEVGHETAGHAEEAFYQSPEFWVAIAFFAFVGVLLYVKLPAMITKALDKRSAAIAQQIDEARRLREEAEALLAQYQRKQREAHSEAAAIVAHAEVEAKRLADEAHKTLEANIARREKQALDKIGQAEADAVKEVRNVAIEIATEAARKIIAQSIDAGKANALIEDAIRELPKHLH